MTTALRTVYETSQQSGSETTLHDALLDEYSKSSCSASNTPSERSTNAFEDCDIEKQFSRKAYWQVIEEIPHFIPSLEGVRGLFVLMVQFTHIGTHISQVYFGQGGVAGFFVLSGFLITGILLNLQKQAKKRSAGRFSHLKRFYVDRFVRLYPALIGMIASTMAFRYYWFSGHYGVETTRDVLSALLYVMDLRFAIVWGPSYYHVTWSLGVEEKFYILWSLLLPLVVVLSLRKRAMLLSIFFGVSLTLHLASYLKNPQWDNYFFGKFTPLTQFWKMILGASLRLLPTPRWLKTRKCAWLGLALLALPWFLTYYGGQIDTSGMAFPRRNEVSFEMLWEPMASFATVLIIGGSLEGNSLLETNTLRFFGRVSYAWYLYQLPLLRITGGQVDGWLHGYAGFTTTCLALICAMCSTFYVEEPIRTWYRQRKAMKEHIKLPQ